MRARRLPRSRRGKLALRGAGHGERADPVELKLGQKGILNAGELLGKAGDAR